MTKTNTTQVLDDYPPIRAGTAPPYQIMLDPSLGQRLPKVEEIRLVKIESLKWQPFVLA